MVTSQLEELPRTSGAVARFFCDSRRTSVVMAFVFLPWLIAVLAMSGLSAALNLLAYALLACAVGYAIIGLCVPASARADALVFTPALGILVLSSLTGIWLRLGFPLIWVPALWLFLMLAGLPSWWSDRRLLAVNSTSHGASLAVFSFLICAIFFFPSARRDAVLRLDGTYNWIYVDTQFFHSVAADIESGNRPPRTPGASQVEFRYHFAPYVPAAVITRVTGLDLGTAFARVTRGASFWALLLSCFGLGRILSRKATGNDFGGIMAIAGFFFYGSLSSLFTTAYNSSGHQVGALLFRIRGVDVLADGGPFAHLILGHSMLHGMIAVTSILALCLMQNAAALGFFWRQLLLVTLPALAVPMNSVAALYCLGAAGVLLFWNHFGRISSWLLVAIEFALFFAIWKIMGYAHAPDLAASHVDKQPYLLWWAIAVEFTIGFGFRVVGFRWISKPWRNPMAVLIVAGSLGLLVFYLSLELEGNERYGIYYLQALFSIFAFSRVPPGFWRGAARENLMVDWLAMSRAVLILLASLGLTLALFAHLTHRRIAIEHFLPKVAVCTFVLLLVIAALALMKRSPFISSVGSGLLMAALSIGFLAWITPWLNYAMDREQRDITLTAGEVQGLETLNRIAAPGDWFATNKHVVDGLATNRERSYSYGTLAERPVLLEGYLDHGVVFLPDFQTLLQNNDLMFTTTDSAVLRKLAQMYHVRWLVARPGTDIELPRPLPPWLHDQQGSGSLKIYKLD